MLKNKELDISDAQCSSSGNNFCVVGKKDSTVHRTEHMCLICEKPGANITCSGPCMQSFHSDCLGVLVPSQKFLCDECISGKHYCFYCKRPDGDVKKCTVNSCGKFYHGECLQKFPMADKEKFVCPLHYCLSCYNDNPKNPCVFRCRLVKCFRCPTAYHSRESCIAAGCQQLSQYVILCPDHYVPLRKKPFQTVINVSWCFICGNGGKLVCCETCPASFHVTCLDIDPPEGNYFCEECISRKHVRCGNIIWVKIGTFRWWPACVKNPKDLPSNVLNLKHSVGEFPIQYFGTDEYFWTHKGRVFNYSEEDKYNVKEISKIENTKRPSSLQVKFKMSLDAAAIAFDKWAEAKLKEDVGNEKPPPYKHIKANRPIGKVQVHTGDIRSYVKCLCDPESEHACGYTSGCINRSMLVECHPSVCRAGEFCENQMFQKRQYARVAPFRTLNRGWALKALEDIKSGRFVIEYIGDLIDHEEFKRRLQEKHENDDTNYYFLTLDKDRIIDAGPKGNFSRFMNHSCSPNCETQKWIVNGDIHIGLFAKCDVLAGTELTFDYRLDSLDNEKLKCLCGAPNCRGAIGEKPSRSEPKQMKSDKRKRKRKQNSQVKLRKENTCYFCKDPGTLIMCDRKGCPKAYHVSCLKRNGVPAGQWQCPWHFCDICGRLSRYLCSQCPNSFCEKHKDGDNVTSLSGDYICSDHNDERSDSDGVSMDVDVNSGS